MARKFIFSKGEVKVDKVKNYISTLTSLLESYKPSSNREKENLKAALSQLNEIKKHTSQMQSHISILERKLELLEGE